MKKVLRSLILAASLAALAAPAVLAAPGGAPAAHGVDGRTFGSVVSGLVTEYGGQALAEHVSGR
jgi:hypothetical protein